MVDNSWQIWELQNITTNIKNLVLIKRLVLNNNVGCERFFKQYGKKQYLLYKDWLQKQLILLLFFLFPSRNDLKNVWDISLAINMCNVFNLTWNWPGWMVKSIAWEQGSPLPRGQAKIFISRWRELAVSVFISTAIAIFLEIPHFPSNFPLINSPVLFFIEDKLLSYKYIVSEKGGYNRYFLKINCNEGNWLIICFILLLFTKYSTLFQHL